ncbi:hypothetical protein V2S66_25195 [Streptomyces sp. V4-01]|uniref:Uncharacterized protein n=1 Tax=Actinacidiphila polyblastidii TaxID=3110430 RepID=A0ABU7PHF1_9ACTN|nr:hypothetical protein [Streptomyces sp. V4-01]
MPRFPRALGASLAGVLTAAAVALPGVALAPGAHATAYVLQQVTANDLGPSRSWLRLQDDPANARRAAGVEEISPFADGARFNGSLHLAVAAGPSAQQSEVTHWFNRKIPLSGIAAATPSYDMYVRSWTSSAAAVPYGAALQLPVLCQGAPTTLSFQPQLAKDSLGRSGAVADTWRHFVAGADSPWSTSRAVAGLGAGSVHTLGDYATACAAAGDGAIGVMAGVSRPAAPGQGLDTYVDNLAVNSTVYEFSVGSTSAAKVAMAAAAPGKTGETPLSGSVTFSSPADGAAYTSVGTKLQFAREGGLTAGDLTVTADGRPLALTADPAGTLSGVAVPPTGADLGPGGSFRTAFTVAFAGAHPAPVTLTATLLAQGLQPLQSTGTQTRVTLQP